MSEERMTFNRTLAYHHIKIDLTPDECEEWRDAAALAIAKEIVANGCLTHQSRYDISGQYTHETFHVLVAQRERTLP